MSVYSSSAISSSGCAPAAAEVVEEEQVFAATHRRNPITETHVPMELTFVVGLSECLL